MLKENPETTELLRKQYQSMKENNQTEAFIENPTFLSDLKIFINQKPKYFIFTCSFDKDTVYVGSETLQDNQ